jgi:hypothetical protein
MTRKLAHRRTAAIAAATLALLVAAPAAGAKPVGAGPVYSVAPPSDIHAATPHMSGAGSDWQYAAIGSGFAVLVVAGVGGTRVAGRRRGQRRDAAQARIAS